MVYGFEKAICIDVACSRVSGDRNPYFFPKIWRFSIFLTVD